MSDRMDTWNTDTALGKIIADPKPMIDTAALRAELDRLKQTPDVKAYHQAKAKLMGASGKGKPKHRKKLDARTQ